jgi:HSP20 family protein
MTFYSTGFSSYPLNLHNIFGTVKESNITSVANSTPKANVFKTDNGFSIDMAVPGFSRDEFELAVDHDVLTVSVNVEDTQEYKEKICSREWSYTSFSRSLMLPEGAVVEQITAKYEAGVLMIDVPIEGDEKRSRRVISVE